MDAEEKRLRVVEIALRGAGMVLVTLLIGLLSYFGNMKWEKAKQEDLRSRALIEITNRQKELEATVADSLLDNLMTSFFPADAATQAAQDLDRKLLQLRLAALNFQDVAINLKPFFEYLDEQIASEAEAKKLVRYAQEVASRQAYRLVFEAGTDYDNIQLRQGDPTEIGLYHPDGAPLELLLTSVDADGANVLMRIPYQADIGPIHVSYFDMPLVDNVKLKSFDLRLSLLLRDHDMVRGTAVVRAVAYQPYMAPDRFDVIEQTRLLREQTTPDTKSGVSFSQ